MMKFLLLAPLFWAAALALEPIGFKPEEIEDLKNALIDQFIEIAEEFADLSTPERHSLGSSDALLNDYFDVALVDVNSAISNAGLDPLSVTDLSVDFSIGQVNLTEGNLTNLATIERYHNVTLSYDSDNDTLALEFILRWEDIQLSYKFHSQVGLISSTGHVVAKVEHLKIHLKLVVDLELIHLEEDSMDFNQTGAITLTYTGLSLLDYILDAMSDTLTAVLHDYVLEKVREIVMDPVDDVIDAVNDFLDDFLRPTTTA